MSHSNQHKVIWQRVHPTEMDRVRQWKLSLTGLAVLLTSQVALAQTGPSNCDAVLAGDLFNKVISSGSSNSASRVAMSEWVLSENEKEAYDIYSKEVETAKQQGQKGSGGANYFGIGGEFDFEISYQNKISRDEFGKKFRGAKRQHRSSRESSGDSSSSLASSYASYVRDASSIDAWKACVTQQPMPGLYAFGSRDESGTPYINVVWSPGPFSATAPTIRVDLVAPRKDVAVEGGTREIAVGSGRSFRIDAPDLRKGFTIMINGDLGAHGKGSFSASASVPPLVDTAAIAKAAGCIGQSGYPLGRWKVTATPPRSDYNTFVFFTKKSGGTWLASSGKGTFTVRPEPAPQSSIVLTYRATAAPTWSSVNNLIVSADGCSMTGIFNSADARGEVRYEWEARN